MGRELPVFPEIWKPLIDRLRYLATMPIQTLVRESAAAFSNVFSALDPQPADALLNLIGLCRGDERPSKIDLGVGVYRDPSGATPVMRAVKAAEHILAKDQETKSYLGAEGDVRFVDLLVPIVFGEDAVSSDVTGVQTPGGTGALRLAAELIARANPEALVWVGAPTWPNHEPIFREAGLKVQVHPFYDTLAGEIDFPNMMAALSEARPGDVLLLHGCCHNPTGADLSADQWRTLIKAIGERGVLPLIDLAYQGLGKGLDPDAAATRAMIGALPEAIVAYSCDKNFGLYRERVGALWVLASNPAVRRAVRDNMLVLARSFWSMPPDHGAATVRLILEDAALTAIWRSELDEMRVRIATLRTSLAAADSRLATIGRQHGMFAMLPLAKDAIRTLRERHGIYMADSGRINIAGLREDTLGPFVAAIAPYLNS